MSTSVDAAREWMDEGDHLLARAYEYMAGAVTDPVQAALAAEYFSQAAQTYLGAAVVHQSGAGSVASPLPDVQQLTHQLTGRLRAEAVAADRIASSPTVTTARRAQSLAETLRERFSMAIPEAFGQPSSGIAERFASGTRSR